MAQYKTGKIAKANITGIENYGIFVSLDNFYSGLIHISEISNGFVRDPNDFGKVGETIFVKIIDVDETTNHLKLSIKDIKYKVENSFKKSKIKETGTGFLCLKRNLNSWIEKKLVEIGL